eukprot:TRINITY_DN16278_c4_g1_i1.p1 TRINITY_DN16278_c4_g1~~TRINITY_DN16278_c4_g1_i1.p1  ORF type:complete len:353 (+),score=43.00 TRINITY_DN16278_c4_g1_i1:77-1135(+)
MAKATGNEALEKWMCGNGGVGASLLRLGKLGPPASEIMVIEVPSPAMNHSKASEPSSPSSGITTQVSSRSSSSFFLSRSSSQDQIYPCCNDSDDERPARSIVEHDLSVEEFSLEEQGDWQGVVAGLPLPWAPGSAAGRKLMTARARQCVICLTEKEHTLVPPHRCNSQQVGGHRFCTDCWAHFLQHSMQQRGLQTPCCPVCRGPIDVPDVWSVDFEIPDSWCSKGRKSGSLGSSGLRSTSSADERHHSNWLRQQRQITVEAPEFWADVAPGAHHAKHRGQSQGLSGHQQDQFQPRSGSDVRWKAALQHSMDRCFKRLNRLLGGANVPQHMSSNRDRVAVIGAPHPDRQHSWP